MDNWTRCVTHGAVFPSGREDEHRAGPLGEQNAAGACAFEDEHRRAFSTADAKDAGYAPEYGGQW